MKNKNKGKGSSSDVDKKATVSIAVGTPKGPVQATKATPTPKK